MGFSDLGALESAVVRIVDGSSTGTGFFVDDGLVVTCCHVAQSTTVAVEFSDGYTTEGTVILRVPDERGEDAWLPPDIAIVEVPHRAQTHFDLALAETAIADSLIAIGFTVGPTDVPTLTYEHPVLAATEPLEGIRMLKLSQCQLEPGMSGAPLLDASTKQVVGVVKRSRGIHASVGGWAVPVAMLDEHFSQWINPIRTRRTASLLKAYCAAVIRRSETVEPRGMRRSRDSQDIVFSLDDVYLSLEMQRYHEADINVSSDRSPTDAAIEPYLTVERIPEVPQLPEAPSLARLLSDGRLTVLLGGPGSGKTTLLQWVALQAARACAKGLSHITIEARQIDPDSTSEELVKVATTRLPIAVRLADFHERSLHDAAQGHPITLRDFLISSTCEIAGDVTGDLGPYVSQLIASGEAIILLDGMDELREMSHRQEVRDAISAFASEVSPAGGEMSRQKRLLGILPPLEGTNSPPTVLVTSRHAGYRDAALSPDTFEHGLIAELSDGAVRRFLLNWNRAVRQWSQAVDRSEDDLLTEAQSRADGIDAALRASPRLRAIARTPLLLTVITLVHEELGRLPQKRADLLLDMGKILVERRVTEHSFLDASDILGAVALWLHEHRATGLLTKSEFNELVRSNLPRLVVHEPGGATVRAMADRFCADAEEQFGLIVERGAGLLGFQHRMLQEFFAALEITNWSPDPFAAIQERLFDPQWREVVIFVACLEANANAQRGRLIMSRLLLSGESGRAPAERQRQALFLAADCLAEIERSLPTIELDVIHGLVELICGWSSATPESEIADAMERLHTVAPLFPEATDLVLTRAFRDASVPVRRALCEIVVTLEIDAPGLRVLLERRAGSAGVCLAERIALLNLGSEGDNGQPVGDPSDEPEWVMQIRRHLAPFGASEAHQAIEAMNNGSTAQADSAKDEYCHILLAQLETAVGVDAILAATALTVARPEALPRAYETLVGRELLIEASDLLIWSAQNMRLPVDTLERWSELEREYRSYVLALLAREPSRSGAQDVAWAEVELAATTGTDDTPAFSPLHFAMRILCATSQQNISKPRFLWLDQLAERDPEIEPTVAFVLSGATLATEIQLQELTPESSPGRALIALLTAKHGDLSGDTLKDIITASDDQSGLWMRLTADVLSSSHKYSDLGADVVHTLGDMLEADSSPRTQMELGRFANAVTMDTPGDVRELFAGTLSPALFNHATSAVDELLVQAASSDLPGREHAVEALNGRRNTGNATTLPLLDALSPEVERLMISTLEGDAILAGALLARAAVESESAATQVVEIVEGDCCSHATALEFALWAGEHDTLSQEQREHVAAKVIKRWPGAPGVAIAARLLASTADNGRAFMTTMDSSRMVLLDALLLAGDHPVMWSLGDNNAPMRALSALVAGLSEDLDFFEPIIAACADALHTNCDWPRARFALHQIMQLGARAPDALNILATKYDLAPAVTPYLASRPSFGVRARAFVVLARTGHFDEPMFDALVSSTLDFSEVSTRVFESLRFIRSVDDVVVGRMRASLRSGGLEAVAALDATLQLLHSYALDEDPRLRRYLVDSLVIAASTSSPWAMCRLPSGLGLALLPSMKSALLRLLTNTDSIGQIRPIMLARPITAAKRPSAVDPSRSFTENFLARVREHISLSETHNAED